MRLRNEDPHSTNLHMHRNLSQSCRRQWDSRCWRRKEQLSRARRGGEPRHEALLGWAQPERAAQVRPIGKSLQLLTGDERAQGSSGEARSCLAHARVIQKQRTLERNEVRRSVVTRCLAIITTAIARRI